MAAGFQVTAESLQQDANRIATASGNIEGHLTFMKNVVESVVNSGWRGVAATEAANLHSKLDGAGRNIKQATDFFSQSTNQAALNYAQREDEVRQAFTAG